MYMIEKYKFNVFDMIVFPNKEKREKILENSKIQKIEFKIIDNQYYTFNYNSKKSSIIYFNNYIKSCLIQYIELYGYYSKNLPQYLPDSNTKLAIKKILFNQTAEILYYKISVAFELVCQIINEIFELNINKDDSKFMFKVVKKIKVVSNKIYTTMNEINKDEEYKKAKKYRNRLTHNFSPFVSKIYTKSDNNEANFEIWEKSISTDEILETLEKYIDLLNYFCIEVEKVKGDN